MARKLQPPSNQMAFEGLGLEDEEKMQEVRRWCAEHHLGMWLWWCNEAKRDADDTGYISSDAVTHAMRREFRVKMSNNWTPYFARIFAEQYPNYKQYIRFGKSKADSFTKVEL